MNSSPTSYCRGKIQGLHVALYISRGHFLRLLISLEDIILRSDLLTFVSLFSYISFQFMRLLVRRAIETFIFQVSSRQARRAYILSTEPP